MAIDDATRRLVDPQAITNHAARLLGRHLGVNRCVYADVEDDQHTFNLTGDYSDGVGSIVGRYQFHDFGEQCRQSMRADEAFIVEDADADPRCADVLDAFHAARIRAVICVPLHRGGRLVAAMAVHSATPRSWRRDEVDLVRAVASRCWESIERARVTRSLGESEARYRALIQSMPVAVYTCDANGYVDLYNDAAAALWGGHPTPGVTRWCGSHRLWTIDGTEIPHERCPMAAALLGKAPHGLHEVIIERADGTRCHVLPHVQPIRDAQGVVIGAINVLIDITERRRAEMAVRDREAGFRRLADAMPQLVWIANDAGEVLYYNSQADRYAPLDAVEGGNWRLHPLVHPDDLRRTSEAWTAAVASRSTYQCEHRIRMRDGEYRWHLSRACFVVSASESQWFGTATDVHEIKEADLARSRLAAVVESSEDAIITKDLSGRITSWNRGAQNIFGYTAEEALGRHITMLMPPDRVAEEQSIISRIRRGEKVSHYETVRRRKDGALLTVSLSVSPMFDADGHVLGASKIARDITARRVAEQRLRESEERFRTMADNISQFAWMTDESGWISWYNRRWYDYTGTTLEQMQGWGWTAVHHPDHVERVVEKFKRAVAAGEPWEDTFPLRARDGTYRWFLSRALPIRDASGRVVRWFGTNTDITEQREVEAELARHKSHLEQLVQERTRELRESHMRLRLSERMASLGTLSAGLGHDMGNLLVPLRVCVESLHQAELPDELRQNVDEIRTSAEYLQQLANGLRLLAIDPGRMRSSEPTELAAWWTDAAPVMRTALPRGMQLSAEFEPGCWIRMARPAITQAVFNLVQNAGDALRDRGHGSVRITAAAHGDSVVLMVSDDGPGMSEEVRAHCMEPFFTTKHRGISTGLGLVLVSGLIRDAGGSVDIHAEPDQGTSFILRIPRFNPASDTDESSARRPTAAVVLRDVRMKAFVAAELRSLQFDVLDGAPDGRTFDIAVIEAADSASPVNARHTVVLGSAAGPDNRHTVLEARPKPGVIRDALHAASLKTRPNGTRTHDA